jgi:predicted transglutaminase-like cysteine proteinase
MAKQYGADLGPIAIQPITHIVIVAVALFWTSFSEAAFFDLPRALTLHLGKIGFAAPVLPPIGHTRFCLQYHDDCKVQGIDFRRRNIALTLQRWSELNAVNREVNRSIIPEITMGSGPTEQWVIAPRRGDCKDYAITKRHQLLALGWSSRALLLAEVIVPSGEHHLVLVVRTAEVDLVLDNLNGDIRTAPMTYGQYQWVRIEMPQNPKFWARVQTATTMRTAMLSD